ncbi:MAG TPA: flagellar biosynthesis protein FliQ [Candidatus Bathyarchaeia archaeon]|nr:flagellar biosynthesis protein FliQ [Candidatus Bathyarchaeia archaeon]
MTVDDVVALGWNALLVTLLMAAPMLLSGLMVGLAVSILQSVTQVQEMTLAFVPKIVAVMLAFILFLPWIMATLLNFVQPLFGNFDMLVR